MNEHELMLLDEYQDAASEFAIFPGQQQPLGLLYTALKLAGEAGEFAEKVGKLLRDTDLGDYLDQSMPFSATEVIDEDKIEALVKELGDVLWYVAIAADQLETSLQDVAEINLDKLESRLNRGVIKGSGDGR